MPPSDKRVLPISKRESPHFSHGKVAVGQGMPRRHRAANVAASLQGAIFHLRESRGHEGSRENPLFLHPDLASSEGALSMTRRNRTPAPRSKPTSKPLTVAYVALVVFLFASLLLTLYPHPSKPIVPNICPIDGQLAEWSNRQGQRDCEYGHFSTVERQPHTWVSACP